MVNNPEIWRSALNPNEESEHQADRISEQAMSSRSAQQNVMHPLNVERFVNTMGDGAPIEDLTRKFMESRMGFDFGSIRIHDDEKASETSKALNAAAYTIGRDIFFGKGQYQPDSENGQMLLAHELAHSIQQSQTGPTIHRRLIVTGTDADVARFFAMVEPAIGQQLQRDPATNEVNAVASLATPATSPAFDALLAQIMNDPVQDAELQIGAAQPGVVGGAFPQPLDLTAGMVQTIDIDDMENIEAGAPGSGVAALAHEVAENYEAHSFVPAAGVSRFQASHEAGIVAQSDVSEDLAGPGRRVAEVTFPIGTTILTHAEDFENYYLVFDVTRDPATNDFSVSNSRQAPKVVVSANTVDSFVTNSDAVPAAGAATIAAAVADVVANPSSTVLIEGFTDDVGSPASNLALGRRRAQMARDALVAAGVNRNRIHIVGVGEARFVAPNVTEADRARNRRVVITVTRPGP